MARRLPQRRDMRILALLVLLLGLPCVQANAQEADAPEGAVIDSVEMSGFSPYSLSPGLQKELDSLVDTPLNRERLNQIAARIEGEQPEVVAAVRAVPQERVVALAPAARQGCPVAPTDIVLTLGVGSLRLRLRSIALRGVLPAVSPMQLE